MFNSKPVLSIGLPVFNGENFLRKALDSILLQTNRDFELIICDNASTDRTPQICREYSKFDKRTKYYRNKRNIGGPRNYNLAFKLSSGKYFKWAAHDDLLTPTYLQKCLDVLDADPSIVLCHSRVGRIDKNDALVGNYDSRTLEKISSWKPHERFSDMISRRNTCWAIHGVIRAESLAKTHLHGDYIDGDRNLLAELALLGRIYEIPDHLMLRRDHPQAYTSSFYSTPSQLQDYRSQLAWWTGERSNALIVLPYWKNCLEYFKSVNRVHLTVSERFKCYEEIIRLLIKEKGFQRMKGELVNEFQFWRTKLRHR